MYFFMFVYKVVYQMFYCDVCKYYNVVYSYVRECLK